MEHRRVRVVCGTMAVDYAACCRRSVHALIAMVEEGRKIPVHDRHTPLSALSTFLGAEANHCRGVLENRGATDPNDQL